MTTRIKKILIADDAEDYVRMTAFDLRKAGYEVLTAANGEDALEICRKEIPNLVLLDIKLPDMDGTAIAKLLKEDPKTKGIPIIYVTALLSHDEEKQLGSHIGGSFFIAKQVSIERLLGEIELRIR